MEVGKTMTWRSYLMAVVLAALLHAAVPVRAFAHPGHGSKVVMGTLTEVAREAIVIETRDAASATVTRVRVLLQPDARFRIDKERLRSLDGMVGQRAIVSVDWEDDDRGGQVLTATEIRFTRPKKK